MSKYNVNKEINSEGSGLNFMDVGIHENCELKEVRFGTSDKGSEFLVFLFENDKGKTLSHTEYQPQDNDPEVLANKELNQVKRVKHIATKFVTDEAFTFAAESFKDFSEKVIKILGKNFEGKKVRIKVIYNYNNYTSLPKYVPFIESMEVAKEKSNISILSIDKLVKDTPTTFTKVEDPFEVDKSEFGELHGEGNALLAKAEQPLNADGLPF